MIQSAAAPVWSPSGKDLAFLRRTPDGNIDLVIAGTDGSNPRVVLKGDSQFPFLRDPAWSPDGLELAVVRGSGGIAGEIWLVPAAGGAPRQAMFDPPEVFSDSPAYTADGLGIVHASNRGGATNIWFYPRRGGFPVRLTAGPGPDAGPTVAADGTIAFINSRWRNSLDIHSLTPVRRARWRRIRRTCGVPRSRRTAVTLRSAEARLTDRGTCGGFRRQAEHRSG